MRRLGRVHAGLMICLLGFCLSAAAAERVVHFLTTEYPPFASEAMADGGASVDLLRQALQGKGWSLRVSYIPWARARAEISRGQVDGLLPCWATSIEELGLMSSPAIFVSQLGFYVRSEDAARTDVSLNTLRGKVVGTVRGYGYPPMVAASGLIRDDANDDETNIKKLALRRFDYIIAEKAVTEYAFSAHKAWSLHAPVEWKDPPFALLPLYIGVVPGRPHTEALLADIESGIRQLRASGYIDQLIDKYKIGDPALPATTKPAPPGRRN